MNTSVPESEARPFAQRNLHVLTLTPFFPTHRDETSGCFVAEPLAALASAGVENTILAVEPLYRPKSRASVSAPAAQWIRYFAIPGGIGLSTAGAFLYARMIAMIRELHRRRRIDVIHAHAPLPCGHAAMLLRRELDIPYVVTVHGLDAFSKMQVSGRAGEWCRRISQRVYRSAARVICISERVRKEVLGGAGQSCRTTVIYNGVNPDLFAPSPASDSPMILSVGNLIAIKGQELLLRSVALLTAEFPSLTWEIIGDGPERARLQALANDLQISERVRFLGRQSRNRVADAMRRCTLFALPSRYEALGCVYLEAMSAGKPVVACHGQGIAEVIRHGWNGVLVGVDDEKELVSTVAALLRDEPRRRRVGINARNTILNGFTLAHQAEHLASIYRECAE